MYRNNEEMATAINGFLEEIRAIETKYDFDGLLIAVLASHALPDGKKTEIEQHLYIGDQWRKLSLIALIYGLEQARHREMLSEMVQYARGGGSENQ